MNNLDSTINYLDGKLIFTVFYLLQDPSFIFIFKSLQDEQRLYYTFLRVNKVEHTYKTV